MFRFLHSKALGLRARGFHLFHGLSVSGLSSGVSFDIGPKPPPKLHSKNCSQVPLGQQSN